MTLHTVCYRGRFAEKPGPPAELDVSEELRLK
jgi:hypothetical protein